MAEDATWGLLAEFDNPQTLYTACEAIRDEGFAEWDAYTPFPVHGLDKAMGLKPSMLPWIVLCMGLLGACGGMLLQWWSATAAYPLIISGKPLFSWPAFVPVTFECAVLFSAFGAVFGMFHLNRIPRYHHPVFHSERFERVTDDRFFISIEAADPRYDQRKTKKMLEKLGAAHIETLEA